MFLFEHFFDILQRKRAPQHHQRLLEKFQVKFEESYEITKKLAGFDKILTFFVKNSHI
jgi:hypothetical protein